MKNAVLPNYIQFETTFDQYPNLMSEVTLKCLRCNGKMVKGFNVDFLAAGNASRPSYWIEGEPKGHKSFFGETDTLDLYGQRAYTVRSLRCENCGYLEHYALK